MEIKFDINLTKGQKNVRETLYSDDCRYCVVKFSRQSGKSVCAEVICIEYLCKHKTYNSYICPTYQLCEKVYDEIVQLLQPAGLLKSANASKMLIETIFGSKLKFFSMANPQSIRGFTNRGVMILDECAYYSEILPDGQSPWQIVFPLVKANLKRNKVLFISTPRQKSGLFYESYMKALNGTKNWKCVSATIYDDELISADEIQEIKDSMSDIAFRTEFLCEFADSGISFFQGYEQLFQKFVYDETVTQYIGIDPAGNGQDDMVLTLINTKGQTKSIEINGTLDQKYVQCADIINRTNNLKGVYIENNGLGGPIANEIKKLCKQSLLIEEFTTTNNSKIEILSDLAVAIAKKELLFDKEDTKLYTQFSLFGTSYSKTGKLQLQGYGSSHDDKILSLALAHACMKKYNVLGSYTITFGPRTTHKIRR